MAVDIDLIRAYTDGAVYSHEPGATITAPTNATDPLDVDLKEVGAISSDGLTDATSQDVTDVFIWQKNALVKRIKGNYVKTFQFAAAEIKLFTLGLHYSKGSTVTSTTEGASVVERPPVEDIRGWVLHGLDGNRAQRVWLPKAEITERGDVVWSGGGITVYEWTLSAYVDENGAVAYRYFIDPDMATP
jgi:hypothetical protein